MIRFTVAQFRTQALAALASLLALAVLLAITKSSYDTAVAGCAARGNCPELTRRFLNSGAALVPIIALVVILIPVVIGIFWGAPLVAREIETGTFRLVWTQSVTRTRWMAVKLGVGALASMVIAAICSLIVTWWFSPIDRAARNQFSVFDQRDIVPIGYAAFAFVVGVTAGVVIRRTVPAMATTLVAFVGARLAMTYWAGPHLFAPAVTNMALGSANGFGLGPGPSGPTTLLVDNPTIPNAWVISSQIVNATGHPPAIEFLDRSCPAVMAPQTSGGSPGSAFQTAFQDCISHLSANYHLAVTYQPASRYWALQWEETWIFVILALVLAGFCLLWTRSSRS